MDIPPPDEATPDALAALLRWYLDMGVDWALDETPHDRFSESAAEAARAKSAFEPPAAPVAAAAAVAAPPKAAPPPRQLSPARSAPAPNAAAGATAMSTEAAERTAREIAAGAEDLDALRAAYEAFEGCGLKRTARQLVFSDGNPAARIMLIGEAPGAEEDRMGRPFVGRAGQLLDRMLAAIGLDRSSVYIANSVPWRPPGNRTPTPQETTICMPFTLRQIALVDPDILVTLGGASTQAVLGVKEGIMRARGSWRRFELQGGRAIAALATLHPAYLLRSPAAKRLAWRDLREIRKALDQLPT